MTYEERILLELDILEKQVEGFIEEREELINQIKNLMGDNDTLLEKNRTLSHILNQYQLEKIK